ncbi:MAG: Negative regulator of mitotic exit [Peltula sp. TS41687]|nr:MAG: Negative regulator of mitotic exit [Peltula sp. TS41687]
MAFLFKSKKSQTSAVPSPNKETPSPGHGNPSPSSAGLSSANPREREKEREREKDGIHIQTLTPTSSVNTSMNSLASTATPSPEHRGLRERTEKEQPPAPRNGVIPQPPPPNNNASLYPWSRRRFNFTPAHPSPFPRYGAAVNGVASKEGDIYMMGGLINGSTVKGDLWMVEVDSRHLSCHQIATTAEGPGPRVGHASLIVGNAFIVFGGDTSTEEREVLDDTLYLLNTATRQWSRAKPPGSRPSGRYGHTLNIVGSKLYIFGGQVEGYFFNDLVAFDLNTLQVPGNQWEFLIPNSADGGPPPGQIPLARTNHTMVTYADKLFLFGGTDGTQWFNDVWTYDPRTNKWTQLDSIGHIPLPREGHAAALVDDVMYILGGRTEEGNDLGDLAAFRISSKRWYTFHNMGSSPSPRSGHSMTTQGKLIIVVGGEPSSAPRDPPELSLVYILDTAKIRYPNDPSTSTPPMDRTVGNRRPGGPDTNEASPQARPPPSRDGSVGVMEGREPRRMMGPPRESVLGNTTSPTMNGPGGAAAAAVVAGSRLPRAAPAQTPPGPPPPQQIPPPKINGVLPSPPGPRSRTPTRVDRGFGPGVETGRAGSLERAASPVLRESPTGTGPRPTGNDKQMPMIPPPKVMVKPKEEEESLGHESLARSRSLQGRPQPAIDKAQDSPPATQASSGWVTPDEQPLAPKGISRRRSSSESGSVSHLRQQNDALVKELQTAKSRNAWYASEMALARRAGYTPNPSEIPVLDEKAAETFGDDDRPLLESFLTMRTEVARMQSVIEAQAAQAASRVAQAENQRDLAISEAVYAKTKLVAHGGSQAGTPQFDSSSRDGADQDDDRAVETNKKLASSLALQAELQGKLDRFEAEIQSERDARQVAENIAKATEGRITELDSFKQRNASEVESLRAELHEVQRLARAEAVQTAEAIAASKMFQVDKQDLSRRLEEALELCNGQSATVNSLREAVTASTDRATLLEKKLDEERQHEQNRERKLLQLRAEHEEMTAELETVTRRLRDAEELAEANAAEAKKHREVVVSGLEKVSSRDLGALSNSATEERVVILQNQIESSNALIKRSQEAADEASKKLRHAEERIAGLEAYQEQASREGLSLRNQLHTAISKSQHLQAESSDIRAQLANKELEANALTVQHGALKDLINERGINVAELRSRSQNIDDLRRRSQSLSRSAAGSGTPDQSHVRELEQQLEASNKSYAALQSSFDSREQEAERAYREKLEQLASDYQMAKQYVNKLEKMLERIKDELSRIQTHNSHLQTQVEEAQQKAKSSSEAAPPPPAKWEIERQALRDQITVLQEETNRSIERLEIQMSEVRAELESTRKERDGFKETSQHVEEELAILAEQAGRDLEQLKHENSLLEVRAQDAEQRVAVLLDQVVTSVDNYRRQSRQIIGGVGNHEPNGILHAGVHGHKRGNSTLSTISQDSVNTTTSTMTSPIAGGENGLMMSGNSSINHPSSIDNRTSLALDHLASELETLRSHWETTNKNYSHRRLSSTTFDFEKTPTSVEGGELSNSLANWRRRLEVEEQQEQEREESAAGRRKMDDDDYNELAGSLLEGREDVVDQDEADIRSGDTTPRRKVSGPHHPGPGGPTLAPTVITDAALGGGMGAGQG